MFSAIRWTKICAYISICISNQPKWVRKISDISKNLRRILIKDYILHYSCKETALFPFFNMGFFLSLTPYLFSSPSPQLSIPLPFPSITPFLCLLAHMFGCQHLSLKSKLSSSHESRSHMWEPTIHTQRNTHTLKCAHAHIYKQYLWVVLFGQISFVCMCQQCVWVCVLTANGASVSLVLYNTVHVKMKLSALVLQVCLHFQCAGKHICWCTHTCTDCTGVLCHIREKGQKYINSVVTLALFSAMRPSIMCSTSV